jgi:hypothetical protein
MLLITALAKLIGLSGGAKILALPDPIFALPFGYVFLIVGAIELAVALICLFGRRVNLQVGLIAWLATSLLMYRIGLVLVGYQKPCPCMGSLMDGLHISREAGNNVLRVVVGYLLVGSYAASYWLWKLHRKPKSEPSVVKGTSVFN